MLDHMPMDLLTELETEFATLNELKSPSYVRVVSEDAAYDLRLPQLGTDYIAGLWGGNVLVIPTAKILQLDNPNLPTRTEQTLVEFVRRQKTPIRLRLATNASLGQCWLLNIDGDWLRVAISRGLSWVPMAAIQSLEIQAVDNSNQ
jgi:hypothetical protein